MSRALKGFSDYYFNNHPVWIKKDYEKIYKNKSELERLQDYIGLYSDSLDMLISKARDIDPKLVYKHYNKFIDNALENQYGKGTYQWIRYKKGYINQITYEYVPSGNKPTYSGQPFWAKKDITYESHGEYQARQIQELLLYLLAFIFTR